MPDLTDADLEAMERRADNGNQQRIDIYALIAALREARAERDTMAELYAREGHKSLVLLNENTSLLAENRLLRDMVERVCVECNHRTNFLPTELPCAVAELMHCPTHELLTNKASLTAAEVERVQRLEAENNMLLGARHDPSDVRRIKKLEAAIRAKCAYCRESWDAGLDDPAFCPTNCPLLPYRGGE